MTLSPASQVRLRSACYPVVSAIDDPTDLRWIARDYRDHADLEVELPADARDLLRDVATTLELGALLIDLAPVLGTFSAAARPAAVTDPAAVPSAAAGSSTSQ